MRLLRYDEDGQLIVEHFKEGHVPPYAILSHTWGAEDEEVTFVNIIHGDGLRKAGYEKIHFCGIQARHDGLQYFWVDSCCIDTTNKAEHSHAIRSMFRWYQAAAKCYVYLSDVRTRRRNFEGTANGPTWEPAFRSSRWFIRGWTLQELLAPPIVEFFSEEGEKLGDKNSLRHFIHRITGISLQALEGAPLVQFEIDERLRWAGNRETKRKEDRAYALLGLCDVDIAPVYGEGEEEAFRRLHYEIRKLETCLQDLRPTDPRHDKTRIEERKGGLLVDSYRWVLENDTFQLWRNDPRGRLLWVKGDPGKGKTMLLCGMIDELRKAANNTTTVSYFFCQATDSRINSATAVLRGLLYMLVRQKPALASHIRKKYDQAGKALFEDVNAWIALTEIWVDVLHDPRLSETSLIIDALDECITDRPKLLDFIAGQSTASSCVKWIVSSRNWLDIEEKLEQAGHKIKLSLELNAKSVAMAVQIFIQQKVDQLAYEKQYQGNLQSAVLEHLKSNANDTFLWVALVCQELKKTKKRHVLQKLTQFPAGLDALYERMVDQISQSDDAETCRSVLACTTILYRPVTVPELVSLAKQLDGLVDDLDSVREIISLCGSFLTLRDDTVYFVHQSAKDFLFVNARNRIFLQGIEAIHREVLLNSLANLSRTLHRDMYSLENLGSSVESINARNPDPLAALRYSCVYWIDHLCEFESGFRINSVSNHQLWETVYDFVKKKYLYWLEGLSLCKSVARGVVSITKLWSLVKHGVGDEFTILIQDARRFLMYHKGAIEGYPLQTYASGLLFSPTGSRIRQLFEHEEPKGITIRPTLSDSWSACLLTLEGHRGWVNSVVFSPNSTRLASASDDKTVKIWDTISGECLRTIEVHRGWVTSVAFSYDSKMLASASEDCTIKIWDLGNDKCLRTITGHNRIVNSVVFSCGSQRLASASDDCTVRIWDANSGECLHTVQGHSQPVNAVVFSYDSKKLASASEDCTVNIWDTSSGKHLQTIGAHRKGVTSVAFSHDSERLVSASDDCTIKIWDTSNGDCLQTIQAHNEEVTSIAFSLNSNLLASTSADHTTVKIWDLCDGNCIQMLEGHGNMVLSAAFSHDSTLLASASSDGRILIWDAGHPGRQQRFESHYGSIYSVVFSHDLTRFASASFDTTIKIWDVKSGAVQKTLSGHSSSATGVAFSHSSNRLASSSRDGTFKIWDVDSGKCIQTLDIDYPFSSLSFDFNGSVIHTEMGSINLPIGEESSARELAEPIHPHYVATSLSSDGKWIKYNGKNILWVPSEYRSPCSSVSGKVVGIGVGTGRVWFCSTNL